MSDIVIKVEDVSKQYRLGTVGTGSFAHDLNRTWHRIRGKDDPYLTIGEENDRTVKGTSEYIWALKNINFEVRQGDVIGIVGRNGAGKSTLLKILSRTTSPTIGKIKIKGRIASLLEVGTGFHPELSGRENIFLNGAILGMSRHEIKSKFDEIVDFAGVERYIDTPVKRYSSGMYVRLAFGVAAHLEPEILIVDEVLAVGDAEFQKKALGKMKDVSAQEGRTVLFVSHNMTAVSKLCRSGILMKNGHVAHIDRIDKIVDKYFQDNAERTLHRTWQYTEAPGNEFIRIVQADVISERNVIVVTDSFNCSFRIRCLENILFNFSLVLKNSQDEVIFNCISVKKDLLKGNEYTGVINVPGNLLNDGQYKVDIYFVNSAAIKSMFSIADILGFEIKDDRDTSWIGKWTGVIRPKLNFNIDG